MMKYNLVQQFLRSALASSVLLLFLPGTAVADCVEVRTASFSAIISVADFESGPFADDPFVPAFSASEVLDLEIVIQLADPGSGNHLLSADLSTPNGHRYQVITAVVSSGPNADRSMAKLPGYPHPVPVQVLKPESGDRAGSVLASLILPVGGTTIVRSSLYGTWTVDPILDGKPLTCRGRSGFAILP